MTSAAIIALAISLGGSPVEARLIDAVAWRESSRDLKPKGSNDNGRAFGLYQFHKARWGECGGDLREWGVASAKVQTEVMLRSIGKVKKLAKKRGLRLTTEQFVICVSRYHNIGHWHKTDVNKHYWYSRDVWREYLDRPVGLKVAFLLSFPSPAGLISTLFPSGGLSACTFTGSPLFCLFSHAEHIPR